MTWGKIQKGVFQKKVKRSVHFHRVLKAWGFQDTIVQRIKKDADFVVLIEQEEKVYLVAPISVFEKSIKQNFGHGEQEFIPENKFEVATNPAGACAIMQKHNTIKPKQHKLF